jgi:hypothetical protein
MGIDESFLWYALVGTMWVQGPENRMQATSSMPSIILVQLHRDSQGKSHTSISAYHKKDSSMPSGIIVIRYVAFSHEQEYVSKR